MTAVERRRLEKQLGKRLLDACDASKLIGFPATKFRQMLGGGPVKACVSVIMTKHFPDVRSTGLSRNVIVLDHYPA